MLAKFKMFEGMPVIRATMLDPDGPSPSMHIYFLHRQNDDTVVRMTDIISWEEFDQLPFKVFRMEETDIDPNSINNVVH